MREVSAVIPGATREAASDSDLLFPMRPRRNDRRLARGGMFRFRRLTAPFRVLPHFIVVGAMKAGTSSLFYYLTQHPQILSPYRKETHYFTAGMRAGKNEAWYRAHFPLGWQPGHGRLTGEATPGYMFEPEAVERIGKLLPEARIVIVLRDPVARAISHYRHEVAMGREYLPIADAMRIEDERRARAAAAGDAGRETYLHASYKARGLYLEQILRLERVIPRERILVVGSGELFHRPADAVGNVLAFLGLSPCDVGVDFSRKNRSESRDFVPDAVLSELQEFFACHNARLFDHLGFRPAW